MNLNNPNALILERQNKLQHIREIKKVAFPNNIKPTHSVDNLIKQYKNEKDLDNSCIQIAGRLMSKRLMGKASFISIKDEGKTLQAYVSEENFSKEDYDEFKTFDIGDIVFIQGELFFTKTNELTIRAKNIKLLVKSLRPLPEKFHGLKDQELKYRQRYVDLIMNDKSRIVFEKRSKIISHIRSFFQNHAFLEVETPMMHPIAGGAAARPFKTHHNALDMPLFLRIAPELYLKRLVVGGFNKVFEINRNFRNEGVSARHNPEFTMIEFYQAYATYEDNMDLTEKLFKELALVAYDKYQFSYQGIELDFSKPFERLPMLESIKKYCPEYADILKDKEKLLNVLKEKYNLNMDKNAPLDAITTALFEEGVEHQLIQPTFITQYPAYTSPLARRNDTNPDITDRFELFIGGREIANGYSELNDAQDQAQRFKEQNALNEAGDDEAMLYDGDFIQSLEYAMPPTAGEGIGIDRLVMLLTDAPSIKDVILFPHMRPE